MPEATTPAQISEDSQWLLLNAIRQALGLGYRRTATYEEAATFTGHIAPELLPPEGELTRAFVAEQIRYYRQKAQARTRLEQRAIAPTELADLDNLELRRELEHAEPREQDSLQSRLRSITKARATLDESSWFESQVIHRDANAPEAELPISGKGQGYKDYRLPADRWLRVRILHPDPPEWNSGVDLIYETYWQKPLGDGQTCLFVRIAVLQYKMWDGKVLYASQDPGLVAKMETMRRAFCDAGICQPPPEPNFEDRYHLPYCCAFVRPTDKKQTQDAWQVTRAWHIPICAALEALERTPRANMVLRSEHVSSMAVTQDSFQELYNRGMLSSRWLRAEELSFLYQQIGILRNPERIIVHWQEYRPMTSSPVNLPEYLVQQ